MSGNFNQYSSSLERLVRVEIAADKLEACLILAPDISPDLLIEAYLQMRLDEAGVVRNAERERGVRWVIREYLENAGAAELRRPVLTGTPPEHGVDARLEMMVAAKEDVQSETAVDHHSRTSVEWVPAGTVVARVIPAKPARDGLNVLGEAIAAKQGRPIHPKLDDSLELRANGDIVSLREGKLMAKGNKLRIDSTVVITGNVDFSTGNVAFPGNVIIEKGVRDCFKVEAKGDIVVRDLVDAATLDARGSITLQQGIAAREKGTVKAGRDLAAKYMTNVRASAGRDALIVKELNNCELRVGRRLKGPTCSMIRGELVTGMACELGELGCESGGETIVTIGECIVLRDAVAHLSKLQEQLQRRVEKDKQHLEDLKRAKSRAASYAEEVTEAQFAYQQSAEMMKKLVKAITRVSQLFAQHTQHELTVHGKIHPGVKVHMGKWTLEFSRALSGPVRISSDGDAMPIARDLSAGTEGPVSRHCRVTSETATADIRALTRLVGLDYDALASIGAAMRAA